MQVSMTKYAPSERAWGMQLVLGVTQMDVQRAEARETEDQIMSAA
jgi:hypothetical protein